jgi:ketosteroid isomerase-like protein
MSERASQARQHRGGSSGSVEIILAAFAAVEARDEQRLMALCHPQVSFVWPPCLPYGGIACGREAARADRGWSATWQLFQPTPEERRMDPRVIAATETEVVVLWRQRGLADSGLRYDGEVVGVYEIRDDALARGQMFYFDPVAAGRFLEAGMAGWAAARHG